MRPFLVVCKLRLCPYSRVTTKAHVDFRHADLVLVRLSSSRIVLLLVFAVQCVWFMAHQPLSAMEGVYVEAGLLQLEGLASANSPQHTALVPLLAGVAARVSGAEKHVDEFNNYRMMMRLPFLIVGVLLGASLWYVARRLYGNIGGYVALVLYCFSPVAIGSASEIGPAVVGAWGGFGLIFTSIAVAHTLYAPREVVLWNWRRILLLGLSIAICVGAQFSFWVLLLPALLFMLWVGHVRPGAVLVIFALPARWRRSFLGVLRISSRRLRHALKSANWLEVASRVSSWRRECHGCFPSFFLENGLGPADPGGGHAGDIYCLEAHPFFWNGCAPACDIVTV